LRGVIRTDPQNTIGVRRHDEARMYSPAMSVPGAFEALQALGKAAARQFKEER
jgi:hypothetical protein